MNYYPFGAEFCDNSTKSCVQNHKYNGKEFDNMHGLNTYDYGARQYNPVTGRWDRIDPLAEKYYSTSPYAYCMNNPVNAIDPDGKKTVLFATTLPGYPNATDKIDWAKDKILHTVLGSATHTFVAVFDDKTNALNGYFAFGPVGGYGIMDDPLGLKDGKYCSNGRRDMYPQDENVINNYINGVQDENLKAAIEIEAPEGMTSEQFDKNVIKTGKDYKPENTTRYLLKPNLDFTANCNKGSYNLLKQSGVSKDYLKMVGSQIPGIKWGWGQDMPWTKEEQQKAWSDHINLYINGND